MAPRSPLYRVKVLAASEPRFCRKNSARLSTRIACVRLAEKREQPVDVLRRARGDDLDVERGDRGALCDCREASDQNELDAASGERPLRWAPHPSSADDYPSARSARRCPLGSGIWE